MEPEWVGRTRRPAPQFSTLDALRPLSQTTRIQGVGASRSTRIDQLGLLQRIVGVDGEHLVDPYRENHWVRAALKAIYNAVAAVPLRVWESSDADASAIDDPDHPLVALFEQPNRDLDGCELPARDILHLALDGESFWFLTGPGAKPLEARSDGRLPLPDEIIQVRGAWVRAKHDSLGRVASWSYQGGHGKQSPQWPWSTVIQFSDYDPGDPTRGFGDVEAGLRLAEMQYQAERYQGGTLANNGDPGGFIEFTEDLSPAEEELRQRLVDDEFGNPENAGRWKVVGRGAKYIPNKLTPKDMEYALLLDKLRDSLLALLGVPGPVVGIFDEATYNNVSTAVRLFWEGGNGVIARLRKLERIIQRRFVQRLADRELSRLVVGFDLSGIDALKQDLIDRISAARDLAAAGVGVSFNEAMHILRIDADDVEGADVAIAKIGTTTFAEIGRQPQPTKAAKVDVGSTLDYLEESARRAAAGCASRRDLQAAQVERIENEADDKLKGKVLSFLSRYEKAQLRKIEDFAAGKRQLITRAEERANLKTPDEWADEDLEVLLLASKRWEDELATVTASSLQTIFLAAVEEQFLALGSVGTMLTATDPQVIEALLSQRILLAQDVNGTTAAMVKRAILRAFAAGADGTPRTLRDTIREFLPEVKGEVKKAFATKDQRAQAIARTETGAARHKGAFLQMKESGAKWKEWITSGDAAVRLSHQALDTNIVPIDQPFANGLMHPHERRAGVPASETVNCRCTFAAVFTNPNEA